MPDNEQTTTTTLVTVEQLAKFSGKYADDDVTTQSLQEIYIGSAQEIIINYLGYNPLTDIEQIPAIMRLVCLEIATLIQQEEGENIGINSKSFAETGTRTFLNIVDYSKYLQRLSAYRRNMEL